MLANESRTAKSVVMLTADRHIDRRIFLEAESLKNAGWQVTIIAMPSEGDEADEPGVVRLGRSVDADVPVKEGLVVAAYKWVQRYLPMNGRLMAGLKAMAWRYVLDQERFFIKLFGPAANKYNPQVFLAHDLPMLAVARMAATRRGAKLVYDSHELYCEQEFPEDVKRRWSSVERKHIAACHAVMTVNPSIARELERRYDLADVNVVFNAERPYDDGGSRHRYFHDFYHLEEAARVLLFQGGITAGRNMETLVSSMRLVKNKSVHLVLLGDGALVSTLRRLVQHHQIDGTVHFHPAVPQGDLLPLTASADAGLIPYQAICLNNYYCTPNKLFEFIATGTPVLGSDLPEIRNIVTQHEIGKVADLGSAEKMALAIDDFFISDTQLHQWRVNAKSAQKIISWECEGEKVVRIFDALVP